MAGSDESRLSVAIIDVHPGRERDFLALAPRLKEVLESKGYCRYAQTVPDAGSPQRYYDVRHWTNAEVARKSFTDREMNELRAQLSDMAMVTHVLIGSQASGDAPGDNRRTLIERDRRAGFDRRVEDLGRPEGELRSSKDRRIGPRRTRERTVDLIGAARRAREHADARFSNFKVGAALETSDGTIVTGCNIENATYGLTMCAERVAMFKALSEGHRSFTRLALVVDMPAPTPPCGACRQILWEFGGNLEIRLANLTEDTGVHWLEDLLPLPFDERLL